MNEVLEMNFSPSTKVLYQHTGGPFVQTHEVIFRRSGPDSGKVLITLLELLKIGRNWNTTVELELSPENIDEVIRQISKETGA